MKNNNHKAIAMEIACMKRIDQKMRTKAQRQANFWDESVDTKNTARMKEIVAQIGWPTISKVGKKVSKNAWLLVQHADHDRQFQKHCLDLMKQESPREVDPRDIAYLEDRILVGLGQLQIYGTQFDDQGDTLVPQPIIDPEHIDERRRSMGLNTLQEGIREMYLGHGMTPPAQK